MLFINLGTYSVDLHPESNDVDLRPHAFRKDRCKGQQSIMSLLEIDEGFFPNGHGASSFNRAGVAIQGL
jgi:hypothetical protein